MTTDIMSSIVGIFYFVTLGTQMSDWMRVSDKALWLFDEAKAWVVSKLQREGQIRLE